MDTHCAMNVGKECGECAEKFSIEIDEFEKPRTNDFYCADKILFIKELLYYYDLEDFHNTIRDWYNGYTFGNAPCLFVGFYQCAGYSSTDKHERKFLPWDAARIA